jgi:hypothetical protein
MICNLDSRNLAHWQMGEKEKARDSLDLAIKWMEVHPKNAVDELRQFRAKAEKLLELKLDQR